MAKRLVRSTSRAYALAKRWLTAPRPGPVEKALDRLNEQFHGGYDELCLKAELTTPVMIVMADSLIVYRETAPTERRFTAGPFHAIKAAAHAPVAAYLALLDVADHPLDDRTREALTAMRDAGRRALGRIPEAPPDAASDVHEAVERSLRLLDRVLQEGRATHDQLETFAAETGPLLLRLTEHATRAQLASLHAAVEEELAHLSADGQRALQVVVAGDHQARMRSLGMQYFQRRFGEEPGEEKRVTYAESVTDPAEAVALVGKKKIDRAIAVAFFGDPKRLQRDILGDAAAKLLRHFRFGSPA